MHRLTLLAAVAAASFALPLSAAEPQPFALKAEALVEIDATGKLVRVQAVEDLPPAIRAYIEKEVATWQFKRKDASPVGNATTWVNVHACGMPAPGGYSMGLSFHGNGPRIMDIATSRSGGKLAAAVGRSDWEGRIKAHYLVNPDGTAHIESIEGLPEGRAGKLLKPAVEAFVEDLHYGPESLDGKPVATRATLPFQFQQGGSMPTRDELIARAVESDACKRAGAPASPAQAIAFDSAVDVLVPQI